MKNPVLAIERRIYLRGVDPEVYDHIDRLAKEQDRSIVWITKRILRDHFDNHTSK